MNTLVGYIAAIGSTTRESGAIIGNGLKTIMSRITTMSDAETALNGVNISIKDMGGNIKPVSDILGELAGKWTTLSDEQRQNLGVTLAGRYQLSRFLALMNNFSIATDATNTALNSQGSSMREQSKYADSLEARINRLDTAWSKLTLSAGNAFLTDGLVATVETLNDVAGVTTFMIDKIGVLSGVFGTLGAITVLLSTRFRTFTTSLIFGTEGMTRASLASAGLSASMTRLGIATVGAKVALQGLLASTLVGAAFVAIGFAVEKLISAYSNAKQEQEEFEESQKKNIDALTTNKKQTDELIASYKSLSQQKENGSWDVEKEKEYLKVQQQLGELFPSLIKSVDATGQYHLVNTSAIEREIKATQDLLKLKRDEIKLNAQQVFADNIDERDGFFGLEKEIERKREQIEDSIKVGVKDTEVNKLRQELLRMENELATTSLKINDHVLKVVEAYTKLEVDPSIGQSIQDFISTLDLTDLSAKELEDYAIQVAKLTDDMQRAFQNNDKNGFEKATKSLLDYVDKMGATDAQLSSLGITFDKAKLNAERLAGATYDGADGMDALSDSMGDATAEAEDFAKVFDDAVSKIESLNGILNDLNEGKGVTTDAISTLMENYPDLLQYINDEATLREKLAEQVDSEAKVAKQAMLEKMKYSETFYTSSLKNNQEFVKAIQSNYGIDLNSYKDLNSAKLAVDNATRQRMSTAWETFYRNIAASAAASTDGMEVMTGALMQRAQNIMAEQTKVSTEFNDVFLKQIDLITGNTLTSSGLKGYETSVYVSDKFKQALEKVNAELEKQNQIQAKFPKHSKEYQNSIKLEINLLKQKKKLLEDQAKALEAQIKAGKIQQTGVVSSSTSYSASSSSNYASGNSASAQIWNFFKSKGFSDGIAAGIMGNLKLESGLNPNALNSSSGAFGIAQWLGGRKTQLKKFAATMGTSINDLNTQLEFLWKELNSTEKRTLNYLNGNQGASAATIAAAFDRLFERSEGTHIPQRQKYANQFYSQYSGSAGAYVASTTTGSQEAAKAMESVDQAKSELIQLKLDALEIDGLISQLQVDLVNAEFAKNERTIRQIESHLKIYEDNFEEAVKGQWMYEVSLQNQINLLNNKRKILQEEQKYISTQIRTNKGLTQAQKAELEMRNLDIRDSLIELNNSIKELSWEKTIHSLVKFTNEVEKMDYKLRLSKQNQALFNKESEGYASELNSQRGFILDKIVAMEKEKIAIDQIRASQNLDQQQKKELNDRYLELKVSILEAQDALQELQNEASQAKLDNVLSQIDKVVDGISRKLKEIDNRIHVTDPEDEKAMIALYNERLDALLEQRKAALANIESLEAISKELAGNDEALKQNADEIQKWKDSLSDVDISIFDQKKVIEDYYEDIANSYVEAMKEAYEAEKKVKLDNLDKIRKAEEKAHNDRMKEMDKEFKAIDEQYNKQLRALNDQDSADKYAEELSKKQTSAQELQAKINALSMDDSEWAKKEKERLEKELAEMQEEIEEYKNDRALELRRQSLEDEKNAKQDQLNSEREAENKAWEERQKALDEQRQQIEQYYENLLENEREWAKMREDIMNGNVDYYKTKLEEMAKFVSDNGKIIGDSIAQNISDALNKAKENIGSITESIKDLFATVDKESKQQDSNAEQTANNRKKTEEEPPTTGKLVINKPIKLWTRKNGKLEYVRGLNPGESYKVYDYDEKYGGQFNVGNNHWVTDMAGYVKFQKYHDGGIVGGKGSRLTELANKLFNEKPNEQTVTALKRELFAPEKNMPNFFNNIKNFSSSLVKPTGTPSVVYNLDLTIGSVTGNKDGGKVVFGEVVKGLKKMGKL